MTSKLSRLMIAFLALAPALAFAVPNTVGFSARVADNGQPVTGSHEFIFRFWDCDGTDTTNCVAPSAHVLWEETQTLDVTNGVVTAGLGTVITIGATVFDGSNRWFSVTMDAVDFGPFLAVRSVPYAIRAGSADTVVSRPRAASVTRTTGLSLTPATCLNYSSVSITVPGPGTVQINGSGRVEMWHAVASYDYVLLNLSTSATDCASFSTCTGIHYAYSTPPGFVVTAVPLPGSFTVGAAGTYTYYLNANYYYVQAGSSATLTRSILNATYIPN